MSSKDVIKTHCFCQMRPFFTELGLFFVSNCVNWVKIERRDTPLADYKCEDYLTYFSLILRGRFHLQVSCRVCEWRAVYVPKTVLNGYRPQCPPWSGGASGGFAHAMSATFFCYQSREGLDRFVIVEFAQHLARLAFSNS